MSISLAEKLTDQFYDWERNGRGWQVYDSPIDLEPPFVPFFSHYVQPRPFVDDGKRQTIVSRIADLLKSSLLAPQDNDIDTEVSPVEPFPFLDESLLVAIQVLLPRERKIQAGEVEQLLLMLSYCNAPVSFEIIATHTTIAIQFVCREHDRLHLQSQLKAYFPQSILYDTTDTIFDIVQEDGAVFGYDFGLQYEFMRPLAQVARLDIDPYVSLFAVLENLFEGEQAAMQILFKGAMNPWAESIIRAVSDNKGDSFFLDAPEMLPLSKEKISCPLFGVTIRTIGCGSNFEEAKAIANRVSNSLIHLSASTANKLIPLSNEGYGAEHFFEDIMLRQSHRLGMLLNSKELATLVHFPGLSVVSSKLGRETKKTKAAPPITEGHDFILGSNEHQGREKTVTLAPAQRLKHTHIIGATGTGKSTLLLNSILQDIVNDEGLCVLDPHGDLIESILSWIPENRLNDVILIDPADAEYPVGFNILSAHSDVEKEILSSDLVAVFRRLSTSWGDQMNSVFANAILAFLENPQGGTLADLRRFLVEKSFRDAFLKTVSDPSVIYYWQKEFPLIKSSSIGPILTRLDTFLRPKLIRNMVAQKKGLDFEDILDSGKILLVKLSQGLIGNENSYLLGTFIVSKIQQAAMARQAQSKTERNDFFLYIDEFQNFITPSMSAILSGARKYHLGLILAHQDMQQLTKQDSELASSVIANAGTRICFRLGDLDAKKFAEGFSYFEAQDLQNLGIGEAIVRVDRPDFDFTLSVSPLPEREPQIAESAKNTVIEQSRSKYGIPRIEVEALLREVQAEAIEPEVQEIPIKKEVPIKEEVKKEVPKEVVPHQKVTEVQQIEGLQTTERLLKQKEVSEHRYLQSLIKRMAESRGYKASIEEPTPDGKGRVDVNLERNSKRIAIEISVTTPSQWELHNVEKCIAAGYETVIVCSKDKGCLDQIKKVFIERLNQTAAAKVLTLEPEALFLYLDQQVAQDMSGEERIKGYRVKTEYKALPQDEALQKRESILKAVADSIRKKKKKNL